MRFENSKVVALLGILFRLWLNYAECRIRDRNFSSYTLYSSILRIIHAFMVCEHFDMDRQIENFQINYYLYFLFGKETLKDGCHSDSIRHTQCAVYGIQFTVERLFMSIVSLPPTIKTVLMLMFSMKFFIILPFVVIKQCKVIQTECSSFFIFSTYFSFHLFLFSLIKCTISLPIFSCVSCLCLLLLSLWLFLFHFYLIASESSTVCRLLALLVRSIR